MQPPLVGGFILDAYLRTFRRAAAFITGDDMNIGEHPRFQKLNSTMRDACAALTPDDARLIGQIVARAKRQLEDFKRERGLTQEEQTDWVQFSIDLIVVHHLRKMKLLQLLMTGESDFRQELFAIHHYMNRVDCVFPDGVRLRYAAKNPGVVNN